jgi:lysophospholipid acyltransferase (LPLAT)-like uncharacterized protein
VVDGFSEGYVGCAVGGRDAMKIRSRAVNLLLSWAAYVVLRLLFLTVRARIYSAVPGVTPYVRPRGEQRYAFALWHDQIVLAVFSSRTWNLAGLISRHRDGGYLADAAQVAGIRPIRGSSSRGGAEAVREILSEPEFHLAITPDGPRGPRREMKEGVVFISSRSGRPLVPTGMAVSNAWWVPGSWTNLAIPKPFSRAILIAGTPIVVPEDVPREQFGEWSRLLTEEMQRLEILAERICQGDESAASSVARDSHTLLPGQSGGVLKSGFRSAA